MWQSVNPVLLIPGIALILLFARWTYRKTRALDISQVFIKDMAKNHLPHVYGALGQIAEKLDVTLIEPPPIKFISEEDFTKRNEG